MIYLGILKTMGIEEGLTYLFPAHVKQVESARMKNHPALLRPRMHC